jgi:xanthine dehydrogenase accessory factor
VSDLKQVLNLWQQIESSREDCVLATIVRVEGSSYRKPGAKMLITRSGIRAGTISGGCLEGEVSKQAWWLTEQGPVVKAYSTSFETDEDRPYGLGCGGTVHLLLERRRTAEPFLNELQRAFVSRKPLGCAVVLDGSDCGRREIASSTFKPSEKVDLEDHALRAFDRQYSSLEGDGSIWAEYVPARPGLFVFGAGDDAKPLVTQASTLGWHITVADGRSHLATPLRFPEADEVVVLTPDTLQALQLTEGDAAVLMTHSYEQDQAILKILIHANIAYLGVLGPRYRTADLLRDVKADPSVLSMPFGQSDRKSWNEVHSPAGVDLGGDSPATIALSILAQAQGVLSRRQHRGKETPSVSTKSDSFVAAR